MAEAVGDRRGALREEILGTHAELIATLDSFGADDWQRLTPNEGWTAKDTLAHLCTIEERLRAQMGAILDGTPFPSEDVNVFNERKVAERRDWSVERLRTELAQERQVTLTLLDRVQVADLERFVDHPRRGQLTIEKVCQQLTNHMRTHTQDIAAARATQ